MIVEVNAYDTICSNNNDYDNMQMKRTTSIISSSSSSSLSSSSLLLSSSSTITSPFNNAENDINMEIARILDSNVSQQILQQLISDQLAAAQMTGKEAKLLKKKGNAKLSSGSFFQRQFMNESQKSHNHQQNDESYTSKTSSSCIHSDVIRTSSFNRNPTQIIRMNVNSNRNSLPVNIIASTMK
ncbi:unnamed protein product [Thelazia callipaeda]|uniref:Uncharacterized protein n=1 Tax=Thelazia callipaeda TaxID=103827 RepID=A0A0N5CRT7_THECL|nr:unnamed protein product [Thelazia callipaeda]